MKITEEQWGKWASDYAQDSVFDFCKHVGLTLEQAIILKAKLEGAVIYGYVTLNKMKDNGFDVSSAKNCQPKLTVK
jgi:hypothetical protein